MLQQVFATMNEVLDELIRQYPQAAGERKQELDRQLKVLSTMSDYIVEEWLRFEEKLASLRPHSPNDVIEAQPQPTLPDVTDPFQRGQGYYMLMMYDEAVKHLEAAASIRPDHIDSRIYLAMSYLHLGRNQEAGHHFQLIIPLTESKCLKAIAYNALGCISAEQRDLSKAKEYFSKAHLLDPSLPEPVLNLKACLSDGDHLQYGGEWIHMP
ncbi:tetratricopeptide repeat protein [Paenibacillus thiaminolyticus]|uniref:tetratricopeptide repeat protein n=1 Tax=Paenibacillus thiaminolyticus TaxID=49283 RepID=UPI0035A65AD9